jgi:hypothetical protein
MQGKLISNKASADAASKLKRGMYMYKDTVLYRCWLSLPYLLVGFLQYKMSVSQVEPAVSTCGC